MKTTRVTPPGMGLIIIGTEILNGRRTDRHFDYCRDRLAQHRLRKLEDEKQLA